MATPESVVEISEAHMLGDLIKFTVDHIRAATTPYVALPPEEQKLLIDRVTRTTRAAVRDAVNILASKNMARVEGEVKKVTASENGWNVAIVISKSQASRHELADAIGQAVTIVLPAWAEINDATGAPRASRRASDDTTMTLPGIPPGEEGDLSQTGAARIADDVLDRARRVQNDEGDDSEGGTPS